MPGSAIATAFVNIVPDTKGFAAKLKAETKKATSDVKIGLDVDTKGFSTKLKAAAKEANAPTVKVGLDIDAKGFASKLRAAVKGPNAPTVKVGLDVDSRGFATKVRAAVKEINAPNVKVGLQVDKKGFSTGLKTALKDAGTQSGKALADGVNQGSGGSGGGRRLGGLFGRGFSDSFRSSIDAADQRLRAFGGSGAHGAVIAGIAVAVGSLTSQFIALTAALAPAAGALLAIPAAAGQALAGLSTLAAGFGGLGNAIKTAFKAQNASAGGGGGGETASQTLAKQRAVESATQAVAKAYQGVDDAAKQVAKSIKGVDKANQDVEQSYKDVAAAGRGVIAAQKDLSAAERAVVDATRAVADAQDNVVAAERAVTQAQQEGVDTQKALTVAREEAQAALAGYTLQLEEAQANEESASISVAEAQQRQKTLIQSGLATQLELRRAKNDVTEAELRYQDAVNNTADITKAQTDAQAKGVDGADNVIAAQKAIADNAIVQQEANKNLTKSIIDVADANQGVADAQDKVADANQNVIDSQDAVTKAVQGVIDAQDALTDANDNVAEAQRGVVEAQLAVKDASEQLQEAQLAQSEGAAKVGAAASAAALAMAGLSPAAQRVAKAIIGLKGAWDELRHSVQENLFAGIDTEITTLANTSFPTLKTGMDLVARSFNAVFKSVGQAMRTPLFQGALAQIFVATAHGIDTMNRATGPLITGLANLAVAGTPLIQRFTEFAAKSLESAGNFLSTADGAAKMGKFANDAGDALSHVFGILVNLGKIIVDVFAVGTQQGYLENLQKITAQFDIFLRSAEGRKDIQTIFTTLTIVSQAAARVLPIVAQAVIDVLNAFNGLPKPVRNFIADVLVLGPLLGPLTTAIAGVSAALAAIVSPEALAAGALVALGGTAVKAYQDIQGFHDGVNGAMHGVGDVIGAVIDFGKAKFKEIADFSKEIWPQVQEAVTHVANVIQFVWHAVGDDILNATQRIWNGIKGVIDGQLEILMGIIRLWLAIINGDWGKAGDALKQITGGVWDSIFAIVSTALGLMKSALGAFASLMGAILDAGWEQVKRGAKAAFGYIQDRADDLVGFFKGLPGRISGVVGGLFDGFKDSFRNSLNWIIDKWNNFKIPAVEVAGHQVTPEINFPDLPRFALGGLGKGLFITGENGPEIVSTRNTSRINTNKDFTDNITTALVDALKKAGFTSGNPRSGNNYNLSLNTNRSDTDVQTQFHWMELMGLGAG